MERAKGGTRAAPLVVMVLLVACKTDPEPGASNGDASPGTGDPRVDASVEARVAPSGTDGGDERFDANDALDRSARELSERANDGPLNPEVGPADPGCSAVESGVVDAVSGHAVCEGLCGNGRIDTCELGGAGDAAVFGEEACDGLDLGGATCRSLGYASGTLGCSPMCTLDISACEECSMPNGEAACGHPITDSASAGIALAANDTELGLAWLTSLPNGSSSAAALHFARLRPDLSVIARSDCGLSATGGLSLSSTSAGWILAASGSEFTAVYVIDAAGKVERGHFASGTEPMLVPRDNGGPLLAYVNHDSGLALWAELLANDGSVELGPLPLLDTVIRTQAQGTFVGDGFLVAAQTNGVGTQIVRLELDGRSRVAATIPSFAPGPSHIAWNGHEGLLLYNSFYEQNGRFWRRLAADGSFIGEPVELLRSADLGGDNVNVGYPILPFGTGSVVLATESIMVPAPASSLALVRVDAAGLAATPPQRFTQSGAGTSAPVIARLGSAAFVAWIDGTGRIGVARVPL